MFFRVSLGVLLLFTLSSVSIWANYPVNVPDYPTLTQLESGWNAAFVSWLTSEYGGSPVITSTVTYQGQQGQIFVVSTYTAAGGAHGTLLGRAFDPHEATHLGGSNYRYDVEDGFRCDPTLDCLQCKAFETRDGLSITRWCDCVSVNEEGENGGKASCAVIPLTDLVGSYELAVGDYVNLPVLN